MGRKSKEGTKQNTNQWITTYTDLMTLLLTFFVLLLSMSVRDEIAEVLVSLQFQDRVSQILGHVQGDLGKLQRHLDERLAAITAGLRVEPIDVDVWLGELACTYTTPEQHALHGGKSTKNSQDTGITFF